MRLLGFMLKENSASFNKASLVQGLLVSSPHAAVPEEAQRRYTVEGRSFENTINVWKSFQESRMVGFYVTLWTTVQRVSPLHYEFNPLSFEEIAHFGKFAYLLSCSKSDENIDWVHKLKGQNKFWFHREPPETPGQWLSGFSGVPLWAKCGFQHQTPHKTRACRGSSLSKSEHFLVFLLLQSKTSNLNIWNDYLNLLMKWKSSPQQQKASVSRHLEVALQVRRRLAPEQGTKPATAVRLLQLPRRGCALAGREEWMKHCFQAVNGECAASFTPLHLKWWQLVARACSECSVTLLCVSQSDAGVRSPEWAWKTVFSARCVYLF